MGDWDVPERIRVAVPVAAPPPPDPEAARGLACCLIGFGAGVLFGGVVVGFAWAVWRGW